MQLQVLNEPFPPAGLWTIDPAHSEVSFSVRHLMVSHVRGSFGSFAGTIYVDADPYRSTAEASIDVASVDTRVAQRDEHLLSPEFFDVKRHPAITFESTEVLQQADRWMLRGELTAKGVSRPVDLDLGIHGVVEAGDELRLGLTATTRLDHRDFGVGPDGLEAAAAMLGDAIDVVIDIQAACERSTRASTTVENP